MATTVQTSVTCTDFAVFQETLKRLRQVDDRVVHTLNCSLPTNSFQKPNSPSQACVKIFKELKEIHKKRDQMIRNCVKEVTQSIEHSLQLQNDLPDEDILGKRQHLISLKTQQRKLRQMQQEFNVEEIIKDRTLKAYDERCKFINDPSITSTS